ncbi:hypothetical protein KIPB_011328, partial [Kipferlia bialata]|eukprot:g11328.t1
MDNPDQMSGRVFSLTERLHSLQNGIETTRSRKLEKVENTLKQMDEKMVQSDNDRDQRFDSIRQGVLRLQEGIVQEHEARESLEEEKTKATEDVQARLKHELVGLSDGRRDSEVRIARAMEQKLAGIRQELAREVQARLEAEETRQAALGVDLPRLRQ